MITGDVLVAEAREWVGTIWRHQTSVKGVACDCLGLIAGVAINVGIFPADVKQIPGISQFLGYGRRPVNGNLERGCEMFLKRIPEGEARPGDVVLMQFNGVPTHMAILGDYHAGGLSLIHAYLNARKVVETRLDDQLRARIVAWYRFPGVVA